MHTVEVIIVGGGPAGSSCAWRLQQHDVECLVLDKEEFPRTKLCAGWITPEVIEDLEIDIRSYPYRFLTFDHIRFHFPWISFNTKTIQHSIRRYEFDHWLLQRSGVTVKRHEVKTISAQGTHYHIDDRYRCKYLIGAGGTRCPVYRQLFRATSPREKALQTVTLEQEFAYDYSDPGCHLWFFDEGLPGYAWYVPKSKGVLNVGIGAMASKLNQRNEDIKSRWRKLVEKLQHCKLVQTHKFSPQGYSYYVRGEIRAGRIDNAFLLGDAAGLATRDMCEGIGPAVRSGLMAADTIVSGKKYCLERISRYSGKSWISATLLDYGLHR